MLLLPEEELVAVEERHDMILDMRLEARLLSREVEGLECKALGVCDTGLRSPHRSLSVRPKEDEEEEEESDL